MKGQISSVKGSLLPQFSCYTLANLIQFFQTFRIGFSTSRSPHLILCISINLPSVVSFIFLGDIGETKLIREATLKGHISGSR